MPFIQTQPPRHANETQIIINPECAHIEKIMMIRTQAYQVVQIVRPVVGPTQRAHVCGFRVEAGRPLEPNCADLTAIAVDDFDLTTQKCIADDPMDHAVNALWSRIARRYCELPGFLGPY